MQQPAAPAEPSLIEYPCDFPLKIMGKTQPGFAQSVIEIVSRHAPDFDAETVEMRASKKGTYISLTCVIRATSREQLDAVYKDLCDHPLVTMVL